MAIEKITLLSAVAGAKFQALHVIVDDILREEWRKLSHAEILRLLDLEEAAGRPYHWNCDDLAVTQRGVTKGGAR
jgi:hypothetical protein